MTRQKASRSQGDENVALGKGEDPVRDHGDGSEPKGSEDPR